MRLYIHNWINWVHAISSIRQTRLLWEKTMLNRDLNEINKADLRKALLMIISGRCPLHMSAHLTTNKQIRNWQESWDPTRDFFFKAKIWFLKQIFLRSERNSEKHLIILSRVSRADVQQKHPPIIEYSHYQHMHTEEHSPCQTWK